MDRERLTDRAVIAADSKDSKKKKEELSSRNLDGFEFDKSKAKILKDSLHNMNVALGTLISAMKDLSILRGSDITPDGKIGGRGFIMEFREVKSIISRVVEDLSNVTDSIADELTNPKWGLKDKEIKVVEKEKEKVEEEKDDAKEDIVKEKVQPSDSQEIKKDKNEEGKVFEEVIEEDIKPGDVKDASYLERYSKILGDKTSDKVASVLSKRILANISISRQ
jgi:hypothetical protein